MEIYLKTRSGADMLELFPRDYKSPLPFDRFMEQVCTRFGMDPNSSLEVLYRKQPEDSGRWVQLTESVYGFYVSKQDEITMREVSSPKHSTLKISLKTPPVEPPHFEWKSIEKGKGIGRWKLFKEFESKTLKKTLLDDNKAINTIMSQLMERIEQEAYPHTTVNTKNEMYNYLHYTFNRLLYEKKVHGLYTKEHSQPFMMVWNTNLASKDRMSHLICILKRNQNYSPRRYGAPYSISFCLKNEWDLSATSILQSQSMGMMSQVQIQKIVSQLSSTDIKPAFYFEGQHPNSYLFNPSLDYEIRIQNSKFHLTQERLNWIKASYEYSKICYRNVCPSVFFPKGSSPQETQLILPVSVNPAKLNKVAFGVNLKYDETLNKYIAVSALPTNSVIRNCRLIHKLDQKWMRYKWETDAEQRQVGQNGDSPSPDFAESRPERKKATYLNNHPGTKKILFHFFSLFGQVHEVTKNPKNTIAYVKFVQEEFARAALNNQTQLKMRHVPNQPDTISIPIVKLSLEKFLQYVLNSDIVTCKYQCQKELVRIRFKSSAEKIVEKIRERYPGFNVERDPNLADEAFFKLEKVKKPKKPQNLFIQSKILNPTLPTSNNSTPTGDRELELSFSKTSQPQKPDTPFSERSDYEDIQSFLKSSDQFEFDQQQRIQSGLFPTGHQPINNVGAVRS